MDLTTCSSCHAPVDAAACRCPACDAQLRVCGTRRPMAVALLGLTLGGCFVVPQPKYGVALTDDDGDGFFAEETDCDDEDADVNPGAPELPDNGVDDDCDGAIDEAGPA
jgi:hypothetical protein